MKEIKEVIDLPSAQTNPLVHPLDVPPARRPYLAAWWLRRLASLPVAFLAGVALWVISTHVVTPIVVPIVVLTLAALAAEYYAGQAWDYIPRKRQDRGRGAAALLQLAASFIDAIALVASLLILIGWVSTHSFSENVEEFAVGAGAGIALLQLAQLIATLLRRPREWMGIASRLLALVAVVVAVLVASATLIADQWSRESIELALMGGATMIVIQLSWWLIQLIGSRRSRHEEVEQ
ncbi:hypothetical protein [Nesterenkonia muleiensis]|uniref:hypothetical protein n=1 Tax=Nesterenkonia muleiensis TaxID=2282648 RepID=UPI000E737A27|nr:hypothetical protein [Nesterenkonia muleiensis]